MSIDRNGLFHLGLVGTLTLRVVDIAFFYCIG